MFFLGQYHHNIDEKGRLTIPVRFRDALAAEGAYVVQGFDHNLMVLTVSSFESVSRRVTQMSVTDPAARLLRRLLYSSADKVEVDKAGRILIPQFLRQSAGLDGDAVVVGVGDHFELWSPEAWTRQAEILNDDQANNERFRALEIITG